MNFNQVLESINNNERKTQLDKVFNSGDSFHAIDKKTLHKEIKHTNAAISLGLKNKDGKWVTIDGTEYKIGKKSADTAADKLTADQVYGGKQRDGRGLGT